MQDAAAHSPPWVALAVFTLPHGVSGRIKVKSFTDAPDDFAKQPLTDEKGNLFKLRITGHAQGCAIVEIEGITKRSEAELLRGRKIGVARAALPQLPKPNQYYTDDLIGLTVVNAAGEAFGEISRVVNYGAGDILEIRQISGARELYAFTHATFPTIDIPNRRIVIHPPEILVIPEDAQLG